MDKPSESNNYRDANCCALCKFVYVNWGNRIKCNIDKVFDDKVGFLFNNTMLSPNDYTVDEDAVCDKFQ